MKQNIPGTQMGLLGAANLAFEAATEHGTGMGLVHNNATKINQDRTAALAAMNAAEVAQELSREKQAELKEKVLDARVFAMLFRELYKPDLGRTHNPSWGLAGFGHGFMIPAQAHELETLMQRIKTFFTDDATREKTNNDMTAVKAEAHYTAVKNARVAVKAQFAAVGTARKVRTQKFNALRKRMMGLAKEMEQLISPTAELWTTFGLNKPGVKQRPPTPTGLTAVLIGNNAISMKWEPAARASHYRVWRRIVGVDVDLEPVGNPGDLDYTMEGLPSNALIEVAISAVNNGGESAKSTVVPVQTL
ncbi:MAG: hypothetical protein ACK4UN_07000 [Limisphaerales bacterium]